MYPPSRAFYSSASIIHHTQLMQEDRKKPHYSYLEKKSKDLSKNSYDDSPSYQNSRRLFFGERGDGYYNVDYRSSLTRTRRRDSYDQPTGKRGHYRERLDEQAFQNSAATASPLHNSRKRKLIGR